MNDDLLKQIMTTYDKQDLREAFEESIKTYPHERIGAYMIAIMPPKGQLIGVCNASGDGNSLADVMVGLLTRDAILRKIVLKKLLSELYEEGGQK